MLKHTTRATRAELLRVGHRRDVETLEMVHAPAALELNEIGRVTLRTASPLAVDPYAASRSTGSLILIDASTNATVGAGMVVSARPLREDAPRSPNVVWQRGSVARADRARVLGQRGGTVWLTGLPSSGKSAVASLLERRLVAAGHATDLLDGDNLRHGLCGDLGFDAASRAENVRRAGEAARMLADAALVALVALVVVGVVDAMLAGPAAQGGHPYFLLPAPAGSAHVRPPPPSGSRAPAPRAPRRRRCRRGTAG